MAVKQTQSAYNNKKGVVMFDKIWEELNEQEQDEALKLIVFIVDTELLDDKAEQSGWLADWKRDKAIDALKNECVYFVNKVGQLALERNPLRATARREKLGLNGMLARLRRIAFYKKKDKGL